MGDKSGDISQHLMLGLLTGKGRNFHLISFLILSNDTKIFIYPVEISCPVYKMSSGFDG
jgi:hypothetical protein